jgi:DNA-binding NarL/FixJ family response regulator
VVVVPRHDGASTGRWDARPGLGPSILVIDRQPLFVAALTSLLSESPIHGRVEFAPDTESGLAIALAGAFSLVFCEARAQPMSAVEVAECLAGRSPRVPVILLAEPDDEQLLTGALNTSVAGMFTKDASVDEFLTGVIAVLSGHRAVGSRLMGRVIARLDESSVTARKSGHRLSPTELDILTMIGQAKSIPAIAASRGISHKTVRNHIANIYRKLELRSRTEAMLCAARMGLTGS